MDIFQTKMCIISAPYLHPKIALNGDFLCFGADVAH